MKQSMISQAFGSEVELKVVFDKRYDSFRDYLRLPENVHKDITWERLTNYLARRAGADMVYGIDVLDPVSYCEELTGKSDHRVEHLTRPFDVGEDLNDVYDQGE